MNKINELRQRRSDLLKQVEALSDLPGDPGNVSGRIALIMAEKERLNKASFFISSADNEAKRAELDQAKAALDQEFQRLQSESEAITKEREATERQLADIQEALDECTRLLIPALHKDVVITLDEAHRAEARAKKQLAGIVLDLILAWAKSESAIQKLSEEALAFVKEKGGDFGIKADGLRDSRSGEVVWRKLQTYAPFTALLEGEPILSGEDRFTAFRATVGHLKNVLDQEG